MTVLVAYASRHGSTSGIAERIADRLRVAGVQADVRPVGGIRDPEAYDAFVVGGAAYMFHWLKDATSFVRRNRTLLAAHPVWLFSSGPLGPDEPDPHGREPRETCTPREFPELVDAVRPRDVRVFFGAWNADAKRIGLMERLTFMMPAARKTFPVGDFRNWPEIDGWAAQIGASLQAGSPHEHATGPSL